MAIKYFPRRGTVSLLFIKKTWNWFKVQKLNPFSAIKMRSFLTCMDTCIIWQHFISVEKNVCVWSLKEFTIHSNSRCQKLFCDTISPKFSLSRRITLLLLKVNLSLLQYSDGHQWTHLISVALYPLYRMATPLYSNQTILYDLISLRWILMTSSHIELFTFNWHCLFYYYCNGWKIFTTSIVQRRYYSLYCLYNIIF